MAKEIKGWRDPREWDYKGNDGMIRAITRASQSDEGWLCPYCESKETLEGSEIHNQNVSSLLLHQEPVKVSCSQCYKEFYVKCFTRLSYYSCKDDEFEEDA